MILSIEELKESVPDPKLIVSELDKYVIGHEQSKKILSLVILNRSLVWLQSKGKLNTDMPIEKSNAILIGESGTGKTALIKALAEVCDIPIAICDVSGITASGYYGGDVVDVLDTYLEKIREYVLTNIGSFSYSNSEDVLLEDGTYIDKTGNIVSAKSFYTENDAINAVTELSQFGIIYLDEIDKIRAKDSSSLVKDGGYGDMVQNEFLKLLEGNENISLEGRKNRKNVCGITQLNTKHISFIGGGAFYGLKEIILDRLNKSAGIGFNSEIRKTNELKNSLKYVTTEDLVKYGFKLEFLGRMPLRAILDPLNIDFLKQIISEPKDAILKQYRAIFSVFGVDASLTKEAVHVIAEKALSLKMGARSLKNIFNLLFMEHLYNIHENTDKKICIDKRYAVKICDKL